MEEFVETLLKNCLDASFDCGAWVGSSGDPGFKLGRSDVNVIRLKTAVMELTNYVAAKDKRIAELEAAMVSVHLEMSTMRRFEEEYLAGERKIAELEAEPRNADTSSRSDAEARNGY